METKNPAPFLGSQDISEAVAKTSFRYKVVCMECGKKFVTSKTIPQCAKCNSVDIEVR